MRYLRRTGGIAAVEILPAVYPFKDLSRDRAWQLDLGEGAIPWWVFSGDRRIPDTHILDYLRSIRGAFAGPDDTVAESFAATGNLYQNFWRPFAIAVLNTEPEAAAASLLRPIFLEVFARGGNASRPVIAKHSLAAAYIDPVVTYLEGHHGAIECAQRCTGLFVSSTRVEGLRFGTAILTLDPDDVVICAVPSVVAQQLNVAKDVTNYRTILNAHFRTKDVAGKPKITGVIGGLAEWIFVREDVVSVTVSAAQDAAHIPDDDLVRTLWNDVAQTLDLSADQIPPVRIIKEKRATPAQTPKFAKSRPSATTNYRNLWLAGDWTDTGLPATIEGAVRSGHKAASLVLAHT